MYPYTQGGTYGPPAENSTRRLFDFCGGDNLEVAPDDRDEIASDDDTDMTGVAARAKTIVDSFGNAADDDTAAHNTII